MKPAQGKRRYIIIGSGVAGVAAAQSIRALDPSGQIHIVSDDPGGYYSRPGLAYYLTGELSEDVLYPLSKKDFRELDLQWHSEKAAALLPDQHQMILASGAALTYDRLLLATGSSAVPVQAPGGDLHGVVKLDNLADAQAILKIARQARTAVVIGGGITALEIVEGLLARGLKVHFFIRGDRYWSNVLDAVESQIVETRLAQEGVQIHFQTELAEIVGRNGRVAAVRTRDGRQINCEMVAVAIGVRPRLDLARTSGLSLDRGILVDEALQSSAQDIFAAGDVAQVFDPFSGQSVLDTLWSTARLQGSAAGVNMAGQASRYWKSVPYNVTRLAGLTTTIIGTVGRGSDPSLNGINRGDSETWRQLPVHTVAETCSGSSRLRLLIGEARLLGAVVMGDQSLSEAVQNIISQQMDITPIRRHLLRSSGLKNILASYWENRRYGNAGSQS